MTRVYALWKQLSGHSAACFRALVAEGAELRVMHRAATPNAPFDDATLTEGYEARSWRDTIEDDVVQRELEAFDPDVLFICSWDVGAYRRVARQWEGRAVRVLMMDNQWWGTPKQWAGRLGRRAVITPSYDLAFVPGERQALFAQHLGFAQGEILMGVNCCDERFFTGPQDPTGEGFLFVGRLVEEKGVEVLAKAYLAYREAAAEPWPLRVAGTGPLASILQPLAGVEMLGFVPPEALPEVMARSGCAVVPSLFEPWGVVVHEAAASGLPVVCTDVCGASTRLVLDGYNGRVIEAGAARALTDSMRWVAESSPERRAALSIASTELARQLTPQRWAAYLLERAADLRPRYVR